MLEDAFPLELGAVLGGHAGGQELVELPLDGLDSSLAFSMACSRRMRSPSARYSFLATSRFSSMAAIWAMRSSLCFLRIAICLAASWLSSFSFIRFAAMIR